MLSVWPSARVGFASHAASIAHASSGKCCFRVSVALGRLLRQPDGCHGLFQGGERSACLLCGAHHGGVVVQRRHEYVVVCRLHGLKRVEVCERELKACEWATMTPSVARHDDMPRLGPDATAPPNASARARVCGAHERQQLWDVLHHRLTGWAHLQESRIWGEPLYFLAQGARVGPAALYFLALAGLPTARERLIP